MTGLRLDHVSVVVRHLDTATAFFGALGLETEGEATIAGEWVDRINSIDDLQCRIVMMKTPDGLGRLELTQFSNPAAIATDPDIAPPNALGLRSIMFEVEDIAAMVARLQSVGGTLIGEVVQYEQSYILGYMRGPEGIIVALAQSIS